MRIAFVSKGTRGDVDPALAVGERLRAQGHDVIMCVPQPFASASRRIGALHVCYEEPEAVFNQEQRRNPRAMAEAWEQHLAQSLAHEFEVLRSSLIGVDLIVGVATTLAASSIAEAVGAEYRFLGLCPQQLPSHEHPPPGAPYGSDKERSELWQAYMECGGFIAQDINKHRKASGLKDISNAWHHIFDLHGLPIIAADRPLAPLPADTRAVQVDAIRPTISTAVSPEVASFLTEGEPPIFVSFSMVSEYPGQAAAVLGGLSDCGVRALVSRRLARQGLPDGCMIVDDEPHDLLFPHLAAVVHHGGAGTTTTAARAGVPQFIVAHAFDHEYWGTQVERLGIGPKTMHASTLRRSDFACAVHDLLTSEHLSRSAKELGSRLRGRNGVNDAAFELTKELA